MSMKPDDIVALLSESHEQRELNELINNGYSEYQETDEIKRMR